MEEVARQLIEMEEQAARAFNRRDLERILEFFDPESFSGFSSTKFDRIHGLKDLRKTFEFYLGEAEQVDYSIAKPEVQVYGGAAVVTFYWQVKLRGKKLKQTLRGRATHVYIREEDRWRIVHEHFSKAVRGKGEE